MQRPTSRSIQQSNEALSQATLWRAFYVTPSSDYFPECPKGIIMSWVSTIADPFLSILAVWANRQLLQWFRSVVSMVRKSINLLTRTSELFTAEVGPIDCTCDIYVCVGKLSSTIGTRWSLSKPRTSWVGNGPLSAAYRGPMQRRSKADRRILYLLYFIPNRYISAKPYASTISWLFRSICH